MRKGFLLLAIVLWALVATAVVGISVFGINGGFSNLIKSGVLIKSEDVSIGDIQSIIVEGSRQSVEIYRTVESGIKVKQYSKEKTNEDELFSVSVSGDSVRIYIKNTRHFDFVSFFNDERLVVEIPESFMGNLDAETLSGGVRVENEFTLNNIELNSSSGGIHINEALTADNLSVGTISGGIHINGNITLNNSVMVESSSGSIKFSGMVNAKSLSAKTTSGGIRLSSTNVETYYLKSSSGGINAESISGGGEAETTSGGIGLAFDNSKGEIKLNSSSGGIKLTFPSSLQFTLDARTNSGGIHTNFAVEKNASGNKATAKIGDNPVVNIIANATSGGIRAECR